MKVFSTDDLEGLFVPRSVPCVSIYMPSETAGRETWQSPIRLKNLLRAAAERLHGDRGLSPPRVEELLKPARDLEGDKPFWQHQREGLSLFLAPSFFRSYRVPVRFDELVVVGEKFHVKPMLELLTGDGRFFVLAVNLGRMRLFDASRWTIGEVDLGNLPTSLKDVVGDQVEEQHLQSHTRSTSAGGVRSAQFHGQGGGTDDVEPEIRKFFSVVDRGIRKLLPAGETPVVLAGVDHLLPIYRAASGHSGLVDGEIRVNAADMATAELHKRAWQIVEPRFSSDLERAIERFHEVDGRGKTSDSLADIIPLAGDGRVEVLFVERGARRWGRYDSENRSLDLLESPAKSAPAGAPGNSLDLLDLASVRTLTNGGRVFIVDPGRVPRAGSPVAALLRY